MSFKDFRDLVKLAEDNDFTVTSTNGDSHNRGSKHFLGLAIDVRTRNKTAKQITDLINLARNEGLRVIDERVKPPGQVVWSGPHLHIEIISNRASSFNNETVLKKKSKNAEAVKTLQNNLVKLGFLKPAGVDGDFGDETEKAVIAFQKANGIGVDGEVGDETKKKMNEVLAAQISNTAPSSSPSSSAAIVRLTAEQLELVAPNARASYKEAFAEADAVLEAYGINKNALRLAHFMAQVLHETGGLKIQTEDMNYSAKRMTEVWPGRFPTIASAVPFAHNPEKLANKTYGGRMGNNQPGDGFKFIGRGMIQLTGRESYKKFGDRLGVDLTANPDLAFSGKWALKIAAEEWKASGCNAFADQDDIRKVTFAINGGFVGLPSRQEWLNKTTRIWLT